MAERPQGPLADLRRLQHYSQVIAALERTTALQADIDKAIAAAGGWPLV